MLGSKASSESLSRDGTFEADIVYLSGDRVLRLQLDGSGFR
jgi:hypothetical protein